jgi:tellurite resistance protein
MGLLSKVMGGFAPQKKATDDVLLIHGMMLMAFADGVEDAAEYNVIEGFLNSLPEFKDKDLKVLFGEARKIASKFDSLQDSVKALSGIDNPSIRRKCFLLAADIAMASGDVDEDEDRLLEAMQRILGIDDTTASKTLEVLSWKYTK